MFYQNWENIEVIQINRWKIKHCFFLKERKKEKRGKSLFSQCWYIGLTWAMNLGALGTHVPKPILIQHPGPICHITLPFKWLSPPISPGTTDDFAFVATSQEFHEPYFLLPHLAWIIFERDKLGQFKGDTILWIWWL